MTVKSCAAAVLAALFLLPCRIAAAAPDWSRAQTVTVKMIDDQFVPDHLQFRAGIPYRLHFVNRGKDWHEFTAPQFVHAVTIGDPRVLTPDVAVPPGETKDLYFLASHPGHFRFWCADHDWDGMVGTIAIK
jgi:plastocyanin